MIPDEQMLTAADISDILGCSRATVYRMAQAGDIPGMKIGTGTKRRDWRFYLTEVNAALKPEVVDLWAPPTRKRIPSRI